MGEGGAQIYGGGRSRNCELVAPGWEMLAPGWRKRRGARLQRSDGELDFGVAMVRGRR
jgi:hypothetical protein